jgi:hypothetical protein
MSLLLSPNISIQIADVEREAARASTFPPSIATRKESCAPFIDSLTVDERAGG